MNISAFIIECIIMAVLFGILVKIVLLMKCTEEKWLKNLYGVEYEEYCRSVNRCIPWFPKNR